MALAVGFPPFELAWLSWFALVPLLLAISRTTSLGAALLGLFAGTTFHALYGSWLFQGQFTALGFGLAVVGCGTSVAAFAWGARWLHAHARDSSVLAVPALWVLFEWCRVHLGWASTPWAQLGHSQFEVPAFRSIAAIA